MADNETKVEQKKKSDLSVQIVREMSDKKKEYFHLEIVARGVVIFQTFIDKITLNNWKMSGVISDADIMSSDGR